jgi:hypothetical protein
MNFQYINEKFFNELVSIDYKNNKLHLVNGVFKDDVFFKIKEEIKLLSLNPTNLEKLSGMEYINRHMVDFKKSSLFLSVINEMNQKEFINKINETFDFNINEIGCVVWLDEKDYHISLHVDNNAVKHSMQIYMGDEENLNLGTSFAYENEDVFLTLPFRNNFGYIFKNTNKMVHGLLTEVPNNFKRYSLYFYLS